MSEADHPIHSAKTLARATAFACFSAVLIFVALVLPAEYNIDPTGIGKVLGLTVLATSSAAVDSPNADRRDETTITLPAKSGLEYKFQLAQYAKLNYEWSSSGPELYFDLHGEPDGGESGYFESYGEATLTTMKGAMTAPFTGSHGWYWRNRSEEEVTVTLITSGSYEIIGLK
jgi:hypothetical protein